VNVHWKMAIGTELRDCDHILVYSHTGTAQYLSRHVVSQNLTVACRGFTRLTMMQSAGWKWWQQKQSQRSKIKCKSRMAVRQLV